MGKNTKHEGSPIKHGLMTFFSFNIAGLLPLIPFLFQTKHAFIVSTILVGLTLLTVGLLRSMYTKKSYIVSGLEMLIVGGLAAGAAFGIGFLVRRYVI